MDHTQTEDDGTSLDDGASFGSIESGDNTNRRDRTAESLARHENRAVACVRKGILTVFFIAAITITALVYETTVWRNNKTASTKFSSETALVQQRLRDSWTNQHVTAARGLAHDISQLADILQQDFPTVTIPDFPSTSQTARELLGLSGVWWLPVVTNDTKAKWEEYAPNHADWIPSFDSKQVEMRLRSSRVATARKLASIRPEIFNADGSAAVGEGPFVPLWQMFPADDAEHLVNMNLLSVDEWQTPITQVLNSGIPTWGPILDARESNRSPISAFLYPVWSSRSGSETKVEAIVVLLSPWTSMLMEEKVFPSGMDLMAVVSDSCQRDVNVTFNLKTQEFQGWNRATPTRGDDRSALHSELELSSASCNYTISFYPPVQPSSNHKAFWRALLTAFVFALVGTVFALYDVLVARRQKVVLEHAIQSRAIVSSLFPEQVHDRLFRRESLGEAADLSNDEDNTQDDTSLVFFEPTKQRLRSFLDQNGDLSEGAGGNLKPIADLFPNCTVLFADISGFTAWSSLRDPTQVFTLLENVYQAFDKIARKRGVFKVETIGDSYVAVTGLPDPQEDHALIMCRFARDCRAKMNAITQSLELTLGPDTSELKMRFGLHSGPVTAGVLRGEKSRFQLFGDTVNTAARMESTGQRDKIQLSASTADLITKAGKGHWIMFREEKVNAKGKGELQTYWFHPQNSRRSISSTISDDSLTKQSDDIWGNQEDGEADDSQLDIMQQKQKHIRLIDYNVDLLAGLLRQVVARRRMLNLAKIDSSQEPAPVFTREKRKVMVLEEVVEVIPLPEFDEAAYKGYVDPDSINLGSVVKAQLKRYVAVIAAMYRNNPFHNFEHASHVTMSVNKLLQRIVAPELKVRRRSLQMGGTDLACDLHHYTYGITSDPLTQLAIVFAALIHDCDHWGVSNQQLVKEGVPIAQKYQNKSVAEQNSVDLAWDLLMDEEEYSELLKCMFATQSELDRFRQVVVNVVMATDIFDPDLLAMRQARWEKAFTEKDDDTPNRKATIVIEHIVQASDVAHSMQHWHVYQKWNRRLFDELYTAYRAGRMAKDPSDFWVDGEVRFFDSYVIPLAKKLKECGVFGVSSEECLNYAMNNRNEWQSKGAQIVDELVSNYKLRDEEEAERLKQEEIQKENGKKRRFARRRSLFTSGG